MSDFAGARASALPPPFLSTWSREGPMFELRASVGALNPASATYSIANYARYYPISIYYPYTVRRVFWVNGSAVTGTRDFGIYTADYQKIYSTGSTTASGASAPQFVTPATPFVLTPGMYYFGFNCTATTNAVTGVVSAAGFFRFAGIMQQNVGAVTLPDPMVPAFTDQNTVVLCGVTSTPSGF